MENTRNGLLFKTILIMSILEESDARRHVPGNLVSSADKRKPINLGP